MYDGSSTVTSYEREEPVNMLNAFTTLYGGSDYAGWKQAGVLTFRSGPLRQNAAYGVVEVESATLEQVWVQAVGSMAVSEGTVYGVTAPGQPIIVKWPTELRARIGIYDEMKDVTALKEVMISAQDGNVYFFNLLDGSPTRDPISLGAPSRGGLSLATNGTPILGVGQYHRRLANDRTVNNGYHLINLLTNEEERLVRGNIEQANSNYSGVNGAALFDQTTGTMIFGGQNGILYTVELGGVREAYDYQTNTITLGTGMQYYKTLAGSQDKRDTNIDASIAMYNNYVYYGDESGVLQCVDVNTLTPVWAVKTDDNIDSTPALDVAQDGTVALYTGNTVLNQGRNGIATIRRFDALTGEQVWAYEVPNVANNTEKVRGCYASPVIGANSISDRVIYTVSLGTNGSLVVALDKDTGAVKWETTLENATISSPVAVYNEAGDAWLVQAEANGTVHLMDAQTGRILNTLTLTDPEGGDNAVVIEASPAVYGNLIVLGTTGRNTSGVYCLRIQ